MARMLTTHSVEHLLCPRDYVSPVPGRQVPRLFPFTGGDTKAQMAQEACPRSPRGGRSQTQAPGSNRALVSQAEARDQRHLLTPALKERMFTQHLLRARRSVGNTGLRPHRTLLFPFYRPINGGPENLCHFLGITQPRKGTRTWACRVASSGAPPPASFSPESSGNPRGGDTCERDTSASPSLGAKRSPELGSGALRCPDKTLPPTPRSGGSQEEGT